MDAATPETMTAAATAAPVVATAAGTALSTAVATAAPVVAEAVEVGTREALVVAAALAAVLKGALDGLKKYTGLLAGNTLARVLAVCGVLAVAVFALNQLSLGTDLWTALVMSGGPFGAILVDQVVSSPGRKKARNGELTDLRKKLADLE